ncbi:hypothetical protein HY484_03500 [Candidatus Woesearchaeota archaeon]|nr:hypothetical protein [Candidatus Woesearchaeota archaeon]
MSLERITLEDTRQFYEQNEKLRLTYLGEATIDLSWHQQGKIRINISPTTFKYGKKICVPIKPWAWANGKIREQDVFTTEGWLNTVDRSLRDTKYYITNVTFLGYSGFLRYPAIKGNLYEEVAQEQPRPTEAVCDITDTFDDKKLKEE